MRFYRVGKTHLLNAMGNFLSGATQGRCLCISSVTFVQEFAIALTNKSANDFRKKFDEVEILLVDDIGFLAEKEVFAREFYDLLNRFIENGRQVVATTSISPARAESGFDERLRSRLSGGLIAMIEDADVDLRKRFIIEQCRAHSDSEGPLFLEQDVIDYIAQHVNGNLRELVGAINRLVVTSNCRTTPLNISVVAGILRDLVQSGHQRKLSIEFIQKKVAEYFNIDISDLTSSRRTRSIARPRQIAMYLSKELTTRSYPEIGRMFGGKDHTTIIHAYRRIEKLRRTEARVDDDVKMLIEQITQM